MNNAALEREGIARGTVVRGEPMQAVRDGTGFHTRYDAGQPIGGGRGKAQQTIRAEWSPGTIHGHPRDPADF